MLTLDKGWIVVEIGTDIKDWPLFVLYGSEMFRRHTGMKTDVLPSKDICIRSTNGSVS
jgi:hypothetical protein